jgi:hypothetical protein
VLAVQAVELLKARLADASIKLPEKKPPLPPPPERPPPPPSTPAPAPSSFTVGFTTEAAFGLLSTFGVTEATWTPLLRLSYGSLLSGDTAMPLGIMGRLSLAGFGSSAEVGAPNGTARLHTSFALVEAVLSFAPASPLEPFVSAAGGVAQIAIEGRGETPYFGRSETARSGLSGFGAGLALEPFAHWTFLAEAQVLFAWSPVIVRLSTFETERIGLPLLALSAGIAASF